jgi:DNA-binding HxlR family transcriptional regulator
MLKRDYTGQDCSIARTLEIVGERWTLLIVRDAFLGLTRFDEFQQSLGIARNVLTERLNLLVDEGILERVRYSERPERHDYQLTQKGRDLRLVLAGLRQWGDAHVGEGPTVLERKADGHRVVVGFVPDDAPTIPEHELESAPRE